MSRSLLAGAALALAAGVLLVHVALGVDAATVLSDSMKPAYRRGDVLVTRLVPRDRLRPGEIAVFTPPGWTSPVAHRVVRIEGTGSDRVVVTKGDANPTVDAWRARLVRDRVPVVVATIPRAGSLILSLRANLPLTRAVLVGVVGCALSGGAAFGAARTLTRPTPRRA